MGYQKGEYENLTSSYGSTGVLSTAGDLYKLISGIINHKLISTNLENEMYSFNDGNYGLGCRTRFLHTGSKDSLQLIFHNGGGTSGFRSGMAWTKSDGFSIILLENCERPFQYGSVSINEISDLVLKVLYKQQIELPKQSTVTEIAPLVLTNGVDFALDRFKKIKDSDADRFYFSNIELSTLGMQFRDEALNLKILEFGMNEYPNSYNFYHAYADVLRSLKDFSKAIKYYQTGLDVYEKYPKENEQYMQLIKQAPEEIKKLEEIIKKQ
jgi:tetratricopeptide (TPR) repeat protein